MRTLRIRAASAALGAALALTGALAGSTAAQASTTATSGDGAPLAVTPPMGWNDWAHYQCGVSEAVVKANAQALVSSGLAAKGYNTVTVDDCWLASSRDAGGNLVANPTLFPDGMAALGSYLHGLGLKFGIYEDAGSQTCGGYPGSGVPNGGGADHFAQDAKLFASWGVDYLKLDGCNVYQAKGQTQLQAYQAAYAAENAALKASGRDIVFSESAPAYFQGSGEGGTPDWYTVLGWTGQYGQLWREGWDIATYDASNPTADRFYSVLNNYGYDRWLGRYASPGDWNDPDFLIAGDSGMTPDESRSQIALWAMLSAPMILSSDVSSLSAQSVADLGNSDVVAVDQDPLGKQGAVVSSDGTTDILAKPLANGDRAVALLNRGSTAETVSTTTADVGFTGGSGCTWSVKDLWAGTTTTSTDTLTATIPSHGTAIFRVSPSSGCGATVPTGQIVGNGSKCVDDSGSGTADGNPVILYTCTGNANQRWQLDTAGADVTVRALGKCLSVQGGGTADGTAVVLATCTGAAGQLWSYGQNGNLVDTHSGLCLDVYGGGTADATKLDAWPCGSNQLNQIWSLPV
ncbi:ricin-type beta-trefoil lectin domain protein [Streptacidiphilus fuscans]|uniref:Alpha-galactosidase n=1 Tax=Streptacidiphilus fuscans TaxID=2789292 RepID=A0A931FEM9_9ACTN|nr:ricin-type beta-trefoil lectin domain protein [Streptacidiphilus fuscans]MBF9069395.1 ricin-type beta-trefoil lectin domain protein [Streptacidiphilus fuscans]